MNMSRHAFIQESSLLAQFRESLANGDVLGRLADGLIGKDAEIGGPFGRKKLVYADYVASGRALLQIEQFVMEKVLPFYANSHTEASYCGGFMTRLRREARQVIADCCGVDERHAVIFTGAGATAGINRLVSLLGVPAAVAKGGRPCVIIGPYEHHSNILPWRESGADVIEIAEDAAGGPNLDELRETLRRVSDSRLVIGAFSAGSNVTGIVTDVPAVTRLLKECGAKVIWDFAGGGPYLPISLSSAADAEIDAIVISPHKFIGGPGASGVLIIRRDAVATDKPTWPGGGTVKFVSPQGHDYSDSLEAREEAGTPNVIGDIRAALAFLVKDAIGAERMARRNAELTARALACWRGVERLELLGGETAERLPIFSFRVRDGKGGHVHQQLVTRLLSDRYGIQARGGCACAGPYVHRLLAIDDDDSARMRRAILDGDEMSKPGFTRLNLSVLLPDDKVDYILNSVAELAGEAALFETRYGFDPCRAIFFPVAS